MDNLEEKAKTLRSEMAKKQPQIKIRDVMEMFGFSSESQATLLLWKLKERGVVKWVASGKGSNYGTWYLV